MCDELAVFGHPEGSEDFKCILKEPYWALLKMNYQERFSHPHEPTAEDSSIDPGLRGFI